MNFFESLIETRRRMGIINPFDRADLEWCCRKIINENKKVFDELAKS
jgi:hypothetical protein